MSRLASLTGPSSRLWVKVGSREIRSDDAAITEELAGNQVQVTNLSGSPVYASLSVTGRNSSGTPARSDGMKVSVRYASPEGTVLDPASISQGTDFTATVTVTNTSPYEDLSNVAMTMAIPSGWEIVRSGPEPVIDSHNSFDYNDIRDDRSIWYFSLDRGLSKTFKTRLRAAYRGTFRQSSADLCTMPVQVLPLQAGQLKSHGDEDLEESRDCRSRRPGGVVSCVSSA